MSAPGTHDTSAAHDRGDDVFDVAVSRRIYRAYQQLQRARADGNYECIVKWKSRVDELLDAQLPSRPKTSASRPAE